MATYNDRGYRVVKNSLTSTGNQALRDLYIAPTVPEFAFAVVCIRAVRNSAAISAGGGPVLDVYTKINNVAVISAQSSYTATANSERAIAFSSTASTAGNFSPLGPSRLVTIDGASVPIVVNGTAFYAFSDSVRVHEGEKVRVSAVSTGTYTYWYDTFEYYLK